MRSSFVLNVLMKFRRIWRPIKAVGIRRLWENTEKIYEIDENNKVDSEEGKFLNSQKNFMKYSNDEIIQRFFKNFQDLMQSADCDDFESRFDHMNICRNLYECILDILKSFIIMNIFYRI